MADFPDQANVVIFGLAGMWDRDAGLVVPCSQVVAGSLVEAAKKTGKLKAWRAR